MRHLKRKYQKPLRPWDKQRLDAEKELLNGFGLKNKKELWRTENNLRKFRRLARGFAAKRNEDQENIIIHKLVRFGILEEGGGLDDILSLNVKDFLERRLQTVLQKKGGASTVGQARQMITHGHVKIDGKKIVYPSYMVTKDEEGKIVVSPTKTKIVKAQPEKVEAPVEEKVEVPEGKVEGGENAKV